ncbi:hypothetical protein COCOBI_09-1110 [Coccomyxa sp. Obi]|nr:hypothetical protein COCOBI_09-1110 [Coccomyxa sp. Obi]
MPECVWLTSAILSWTSFWKLPCDKTATFTTIKAGNSIYRIKIRYSNLVHGYIRQSSKDNTAKEIQFEASITLSSKASDQLNDSMATSRKPSAGQTRSISKCSFLAKATASLLLVLFLCQGTVQGRMLKQAANTRQGTVSTANSTPYSETMRPVTSSSRTSSSAGTRPTGVVSIDGSTAMADTQQTQSLRSVTPSGYAPLAQTHGASGTVTTDQATVGPVRPINGNGTPVNMQASRASSQNMETMNDAGSAMSMRQMP